MMLRDNLAVYKSLGDAKLSIDERCKLAQGLWERGADAGGLIDPRQFVLEWLAELIVQKKRLTLNEKDLVVVWERFNLYINELQADARFSVPTALVQVLVDSLGAKSPLVKACALRTCTRLLQTKYAVHFVKNFDQMTRLLSCFVDELNGQLLDSAVVRVQDEELEATGAVLQKYFMCLKSQQNHNRFFNRLCSQMLPSLLSLIENLKYTLKASRLLADDLVASAWKILKFGLFSKSQANVYAEFFRNLPGSFSNRSNYQVAVLFTTIQSEARKNAASLNSICRNVGEMARELFAIVAGSAEYKHQVLIIQFLVDLVWEIKFPATYTETDAAMEVDQETADVEMSSESGAEVDLILDAIASLFEVFDDLNVFKPIEDENHGGLFKNWCKNFIAKTFKCKFNHAHSNCFVRALRIDHHIMDPFLDTILREFQAENNLEAFLVALLDSNVKFRQLSRITHKLVESLSKNERLEFPLGFYKHYEACLENYKVGIQTILNIWQDIVKIIEQPAAQIKPNLRGELCKLLNCILCRVNMSNPRLPVHVKTQSSALLARTKSILVEYLAANYDRSSSSSDQQLLDRYLEAFYSCGQLYLIIYRYSVRSTRDSDDATITVAHSADSIAGLNDFFVCLNDPAKFDLAGKLQKLAAPPKGKANISAFRRLLLLQKLQLVNLYAVNVITESENENKFDARVLGHIKSNVQAFFADTKRLLSGLGYSTLLDNSDRLSKLLLNSSGTEADLIDSETSYGVFHLKHLMLDHAEVLLNTFRIAASGGLDSDYRQLDFVKSALGFAAAAAGGEQQTASLDFLSSSALFNDQRVLGDVFLGLVALLDEAGDAGTKKHAHKFFASIAKFIEADYDQALLTELSESKKNAKFSLNERQTNLLLRALEQLPVEYLRPELAFVCFLISQQLDLDASSATRLQFLRINLKIFSSSRFVELMSMIADERLEAWIVYLFDLFDQENGLVDESVVQLERGVFETLVKKSISFLMRRERSLDTLASLVGILLAKISSKQNEHTGLGFVQLANQAFIYILRKSLSLNDANNKSSSDAESKPGGGRKLDFLFDTLIEYFANLSSLARSADSGCDNQENDFIICSVLLKRASMTTDDASSSLSAEKRDFLKRLYEQCLKAHKAAVKRLKEDRSVVSQAHVDFIKSCISCAPKLADNKEVKINRVKVCQSLVDMLLLLDPASSSSDRSSRAVVAFKTLSRDIVYSIGQLGSDEFQQIVETIGARIFQEPNFEAEKDKIVRLLELVREVCSSTELLAEANREAFLHFVEKILIIQIQPLFVAFSHDVKTLTSLLDCQLAIASSKNVSLPSQTVISMLQIFALVSFGDLELRECFPLQQIICKSISNLIMKYSKKFTKIAAVVCNLMITMTTNMCNQNYLKDDEDIELAVQAVQDLDRVCAQLVDFKKDFSKISPYMISEYVTKATLIPIHPVVKTTLSNAVYNLISICDIHGIAQLHVLLNVASKELFRTLYGEYEKYFKYTGKA